MFSGYLKLAGQEIINSARTEAYAAAFLPGIDVLPMSGGLRTWLAHAAYKNPQADLAPWYTASDPNTARFYGLYPTGASGGSSSTRSVEVTQLGGDGAVHGTPRHSSREIRFTAVALAADDAALEAGMAWLRAALDPGGCAGGGDCSDWEAMMLTAVPSAAGVAEQRYFYRVQPLEGPIPGKGFASKRVSAVMVEFTLSAGVPWAFHPAVRLGELAMASGYTSVTDPTGENCWPESAGYNQFISDPFFTAIARPPAAPVVKPPNILKVLSWRRKTALVPVLVSRRWGRAVPVLRIAAGTAAVQQMRIRLYSRTTNLAGCDFAGEFLLSYLPPGAVMTIDGRTREVVVVRSDGVVVPGAHLLYGSDGLPPTWPALSCVDQHTVVVDLMPGTSTATVTVDVAARE